eukprot:12364081-Alexandrium_andersonii.AAC.1
MHSELELELPNIQQCFRHSELELCGPQNGLNSHTRGPRGARSAPLFELNPSLTTKGAVLE